MGSLFFLLFFAFPMFSFSRWLLLGRDNVTASHLALSGSRCCYHMLTTAHLHTRDDTIRVVNLAMRMSLELSAWLVFEATVEVWRATPR